MGGILQPDLRPLAIQDSWGMRGAGAGKGDGGRVIRLQGFSDPLQPSQNSAVPHPLAEVGEAPTTAAVFASLESDLWLSNAPAVGAH